jgi:hypothetical protein
MIQQLFSSLEHSVKCDSKFFLTRVLLINIGGYFRNEYYNKRICSYLVTKHIGT